ncbi:hypothetical protein DVH24_002304 [Malus domestica]|uniref:Uncharacterized protein n=1 Tax=Malus domestica TaxID=3750 RepID=A0A498I5K2_MALDO|nr:hypothetical protein DVH24_002304 [Malus domestica]
MIGHATDICPSLVDQGGFKQANVLGGFQGNKGKSMIHSPTPIMQDGAIIHTLSGRIKTMGNNLPQTTLIIHLASFKQGCKHHISLFNNNNKLHKRTKAIENLEIQMSQLANLMGNNTNRESCLTKLQLQR